MGEAAKRHSVRPGGAMHQKPDGSWAIGEAHNVAASSIVYRGTPRAQATWMSLHWPWTATLCVMLLPIVWYALLSLMTPKLTLLPEVQLKPSPPSFALPR